MDVCGKIVSLSEQKDRTAKGKQLLVGGSNVVFNPAPDPSTFDYRGVGPYYGPDPGDAGRATAFERVHNMTLFLAHWSSRTKPNKDHLLPAPCHWCGEPSGDWCEPCVDIFQEGTARTLCSSCEKAVRMCRLCHNARVLSGKQLHATDGSAWLGTFACANCDARARGMSLCQACGVARYCSSACQRAHWGPHKQWCQTWSCTIAVPYVLPERVPIARTLAERDGKCLPPIMPSEIVSDIFKRARGSPQV